MTEAGKRLYTKHNNCTGDYAILAADIDAIEAEAYDKGMIDGGKIVVEARRGLEAAYERERIKAAVKGLWKRRTFVSPSEYEAAVLAIIDEEVSDG